MFTRGDDQYYQRRLVSRIEHHRSSFGQRYFLRVENRRPMLVAANTGLSAWIDGGGRLIDVSPRLVADSIIARPIRDGRWGIWQSIGDWPARCIALLCVGLSLPCRDSAT